MRKYIEIVEKGLKPAYDVNGDRLPINYNGIIANITGTYSNKAARSWGYEELKKIDDLLANIFAMWTLMSSEHYVQQQSQDPTDRDLKLYLIQPHAAQITSILRILGVGYTRAENATGFLKNAWNKVFGDGEDRQIYDNLVQIKTGEGKSVTLAIVSMVLALHGFNVRCACYSKYLSERDFKSFYKMFDELSLTDSISYGTFNEICEQQINRDGSIRDIVLRLILKGSVAPQIVIDRDTASRKPQVLMIDEVDVFFSKDFFGNIYTPSAEVKHPTVEALIDLIWEKSKEKAGVRIKFAEIKDTPQY